MPAEPQRRPCLVEQYVAAEGTAAPVVAAMGAACAAIAAGDQDERIPLAAATLRACGDAEDRLAAELCPLLWRLQRGGDALLLERAVRVFAEWMTYRPRLSDFVQGPRHAERLQPFAARVLHEWLHQRCGKCGGSGRLQITAKGAVRTLGTNARNTKFTSCDLCVGLGHGQSRPAEQAAAIGVTLQVYDSAGWHVRFRAARAWLLKLMRRPRRHLRRELGLL